MKLRFLIFIRMWYYLKIFNIVRELHLNHITAKDPAELLRYWEEVYRAKISRLLQKESDRFFK